MMLSLRVDSLAEMRQTLPTKGQHCFGAVFSDDVGKWAIQVRQKASSYSLRWFEYGQRWRSGRAIPGHKSTHALLDPYPAWVIHAWCSRYLVVWLLCRV
jgi:hypothetical protein